MKPVQNNNEQKKDLQKATKTQIEIDSGKNLFSWELIRW